MIAFYAIRDSVRKGNIPNNAYVRSQIQEIGSVMLAPDNIKFVLAELGRNQFTDEDRVQMNAMTETDRLKFMLNRLMLRDAPATPADYSSKVEKYIGMASAQTAWKRRAATNFVKEQTKNLLGINPMSWNPVTWPVGVLKYVGKGIASVAPDFVVGGAKKVGGEIKSNGIPMAIGGVLSLGLPLAGPLAFGAFVGGMALGRFFKKKFFDKKQEVATAQP